MHGDINYISQVGTELCKLHGVWCSYASEAALLKKAVRAKATSNAGFVNIYSLLALLSGHSSCGYRERFPLWL